MEFRILVMLHFIEFHVLVRGKNQKLMEFHGIRCATSKDSKKIINTKELSDNSYITHNSSFL